MQQAIEQFIQQEVDKKMTEQIKLMDSFRKQTGQKIQRMFDDVNAMWKVINRLSGIIENKDMSNNIQNAQTQQLNSGDISKQNSDKAKLQVQIPPRDLQSDAPEQQVADDDDILEQVKLDLADDNKYIQLPYDLYLAMQKEMEILKKELSKIKKSCC